MATTQTPELTQPMLQSRCTYGQHFPSRRPALVAMRLTLLTLSLTFGICYYLWLQRGCLAFLPYISDLGLQGHMKIIFMSGLLLAAILMTYTLPHIVCARRSLLHQLNSPRKWCRLNDLVAVAGVGVAVGLAALGFLPWDQSLFGHLVATNFIFGGGIVWSTGSVLLAWHLRTQSSRTWDCSRWSRRLQAPPLVAILINFVVSGIGFGSAFISAPKVFDPKVALRLARTDFQAYCTGQEGWHGLLGVNIAALTEWLLVLFLLVAVVASLADIEAYADFHRSPQLSVQALASTSEGAANKKPSRA